MSHTILIWSRVLCKVVEVISRGSGVSERQHRKLRCRTGSRKSPSRVGRDFQKISNIDGRGLCSVLEEHAVDAGPVLKLRSGEGPTTCPI
jgi:hypothetical protein